MPESLVSAAAMAISLVLTTTLVPLVRRLAIRHGYISRPSVERWSKRPTAYLGGVPLFVGVLIGVSPAILEGPALLPLLAVSASMFAVGLYDDLRRISPTTKLSFQVLAAGFAIMMGFRFRFFTSPPLDILLTAAWIVGLTNAINLLDNMDGLASGVSLIAALCLAYFLHANGDLLLMRMALATAGALAGFLIYNSYPASIFMGDSGSLFLGSTLALLSISTHGNASNVLSLVAVPTLILLVPILDTSLVVVTRLWRGHPVFAGGTDHSSHRLVALGLNEPRAVRLLYLMACVSGVAAILLDRLPHLPALLLLFLVLISFALLTAYLARVKIVSREEGRESVDEPCVTER